MQTLLPTDAQTVLETIADGVVVVGPDGVVLFANPSAHEILEREQLVGCNFGLPFDIEKRRTEVQIIRKSGLGWAAIRAARIQWRGQEARVLAFNDITTVKLAWQDVELSSQVFRASGEGIVITDRHLHIISVNAAFTRITGYQLGDVLDQRPSLLATDRQPADFFAKMGREIAEQGRWTGEIWVKRKNGEEFPAWLSTSVVRDEHGAIQHYFAIISDLSEHKAAQDRIHRLANFDILTGLPNRLLLQDRVTIAINAAHRAGRNLALLFLDLDRFKSVNETLGHHFGDALLQQVTERFSDQLRDEDTLSRLGGDEFVLLLNGADAQQAAHVARKLIGVMAAPFLLGQHELNMSTSIGIALYPDNGDDMATLARAADTALFRAKQDGRNTFRFFTEDMHQQAQRMMEIESRLRRALAKQELFLCYQPQVDIRSYRLIGLEALVRWRHPTLGIVPPAEFIPVAEECGLIGDIGRWVLREAIRQNKTWREAGLSIVPVAVNLSVAQFQQTPLCEDILGALREAGLPPNYLELEITESIASENFESNLEKLEHLCELGVTISIDDFGTGYSSLSRLKRFDVQKIKIDKSFVDGVASNNDDAAIVRTIIGMAINLGFRSIAEGVENLDQLEFLRANGCDEVQGYLFAKPQLPDDIESILARGGIMPPPQGVEV